MTEVLNIMDDRVDDVSLWLTQLRPDGGPLCGTRAFRPMLP